MKLAYLIPEWPGLSHVWAWREISHLRELGVEVSIFSTRVPTSKNAGNHSFASKPEAAAFYLWPMKPLQVIGDLCWAMTQNFPGFLRAVKLGFTLPLDQKPSFLRVLPLLLPACRIAREARRQNIDHFHTPIPASSAILCMMVKQMLGTPYSLTIVANFSDWGGALQEKMDDASFVGLIAQWMFDEIDDYCPGVDKAKLVRISHGCDSQSWTPLPPHEKPSREIVRIISIGRIARNKGYDVLLQALAEVKDRGVEFECRIAGDGPEMANIQALIETLHLQNEVTMLGGLTEQQCLHEARQADIFALASFKEPLGVVFHEAMATGLPAIGTEAGGVVDIITHDVNGLLVPPHEVTPLADALLRLIQDPELRQRLGAEGRQTIIEKFDCRIGARTLRDQIYKAHGQEPPAEPVDSADQSESEEASRTIAQS